MIFRVLFRLYFTRYIADKYSSQFGGGSNQYAYIHEEDESSFQLVDPSKVQKPIYQRGRGRFNQVRLVLILTCMEAELFNCFQQKVRRDRERRQQQQANMQVLTKIQKSRER